MCVFNAFKQPANPCLCVLRDTHTGARTHRKSICGISVILLAVRLLLNPLVCLLKVVALTFDLVHAS